MSDGGNSDTKAKRPLGDHGQASLGLEGASSGSRVLRGCAVKSATGELQFSQTHCQGAIASGAFVPGLRTASGWGQLHVTTSGDHSDADQLRAAGFLEAYLTAEQIHAHRHNLGAHFKLASTDKPVQWLLEQHAWAQQQAAANATPFWRAMALLLAQLDGLVEGYAAAVREQEGSGSGHMHGQGLPHLGLEDFLFVSAVGDLDDIIPATTSNKTHPPVLWEELSAKQVEVKLGSSGKCSALIKVADDLSDIQIAHSAWFTYGGLVRIYKHYDFQVSDPQVQLSGMSFSGYPGELSSDDDFYLLDTGMVVLQTTNSVYNTSLYELVKPESALSWQRARIANFLASSGEEWVGHMDTHSSGTLNGQWMVLDLKRFTPGQELVPGLLWVVEQAPGLTYASDVTMTLERGYWPSYNVPYYPAIYNWSGYPEFVASQAARGPHYANAVSGASYQLAPRAKIFRRDVRDVTGLHSLQAFMRSNGWPQDPFNGGSPLGAICGRGDVDPQEPVAYGCIDTKITNAHAARQRRAYAVAGPTTGGGALPPFEWSGALADSVEHMGQPERFNFSFELMTPEDEDWGISLAATF